MMTVLQKDMWWREELLIMMIEQKNTIESLARGGDIDDTDG